MMNKYKKYLPYVAVTIWFFILTTLILYVFFPYQKIFRLAFMNFISSSKMVVSVEGARIRPLSARASKVVFGHEALQGKPLFELEKVKVSWNPLSIFKGVINISSEATTYSGVTRFWVSGVPVLANSTPVLTVSIANISLSKYPDDRVPWFKGITGIMNVWMRKEIPLFSLDRQKGNFLISLQNGEIKEIRTKNFPKITLPYKEIKIEGKIEGERILLSKIFINSFGNVIKGNGTIESNEYEQKINLKLDYEATSKGAPLSGKGTITIIGNQWSPDILVTPSEQKQ